MFGRSTSHVIMNVTFLTRDNKSARKITDLNTNKQRYNTVYDERRDVVTQHRYPLLRDHDIESDCWYREETEINSDGEQMETNNT